MKLNNKGFTLIEILTTVAIMSMLSGVAVMAVTRYIEKTQREAYEIMQKTVYDAAASYHQKKPSATSVAIATLKSEGYLVSLQDPTNKNGTCSGSVSITSTTDPTDPTALVTYKYEVDLNCKKYHDSPAPIFTS